MAFRDRVLVANPALLNPFQDASEIAVTGPDTGTIRQAGGFANYGEAAGLLRDGTGAVAELHLGGTRLLPEAALAAEMTQRYRG